MGLLVLGIGATLLTPLPVLLFMPGRWQDAIAFAGPALLGILAGGGMWHFLRGDDSASLTPREAAVIVSFTWLAGMALGAIPFVVGGQLPWLDALYEAMSGWTGAGLTMFTHLESIPSIYLLWRSTMEYLGGAGFAVLMLSAVIGPRAVGLYEAEARSDRLVPSILDTARLFLQMYGLYLVIGTGLYWAVGMTLFDALNHAMTALSAGGFSTKTESIGYFDSIGVEIVTVLLMLLGSINFTTHYAFYSRRRWKALQDTEMYTLLMVMTVFLPVTTYAVIQFQPHLDRPLRVAVFQVISAGSTTGFGTANLSQWNDLPLMALTLLMIFGGGTGATAGGIKLYRVGVIGKTIAWSVKQRLYPERVVLRRTIYRRGELVALSEKELLDVGVVVALYLITYMVGVLIFLSHGFDLARAAFEFASALSTVGLSVGITGPTMTPLLKITQMAGMWLGRLEFLAVLVALTKVSRDFV